LPDRCQVEVVLGGDLTLLQQALSRMQLPTLDRVEKKLSDLEVQRDGWLAAHRSMHGGVGRATFLRGPEPIRAMLE
jgi:hypothetical protein